MAEAAGGARPRLFVLGQNPGQDEDWSGRLFTGKTSQYHRDAERHAGLDRYPITRQNAVRCATPDDRPPTDSEVKLCRPLLDADLAAADPQLVLVLGAAALYGALGQKRITEKTGTVQRVGGRLYLPLFHPAAVSREPARYEHGFTQALIQAAALLQDLELGNTAADRLAGRYHILSTLDSVLDLVDRAIARGLPIGFDTEFFPGDKDDWDRDLQYVRPEDFTVLGCSICLEPGEAFFIPLDHPESPFVLDESIQQAIVRLCESVPLNVHNAPAEIHSLRALGADLRRIRIADDTLLASILAHGKDGGHKLKDLAYRDADTGGYDLPLEHWKEESEAAWLLLETVQQNAAKPPGKRTVVDPAALDAAIRWLVRSGGRHYQPEFGYASIPLALLGAPYAAGDADTTQQLVPVLRDRLRQQGQLDFYDRVQKHAWLHNYLLKDRGLLLDWDAWAARDRAFTDRRAALVGAIEAEPAVAPFAGGLAAQGKAFSLDSDPQMRTLFFEVLGLPPSGIYTEKTGQHSVNQEALTLLRSRGPSPILEAYAEYQALGTLQTTFLNGYATKCYPDGRLHPNWHSFIHSGRRGSSRPPAQNLTAGSYDPADLQNLRMLIWAGPGRRFVAVDWAQQEFRLASCYSRDPNMLAACRAGDPHQLLATALTIERRVAKTLNFAFLYGAGWEKLQSVVLTDLGVAWSDAEALRHHAGLQETYGGFFAWKAAFEASLLRTGSTITVLGHRRALPGVFSGQAGPVGDALREGWNHQCQSAGHACTQTAMMLFQAAVWAGGHDWHLVLDLHDGIIADVPEADVAAAARVLRDAAAIAGPLLFPPAWLVVPLPVEVSSGTHFGNLVPLALDSES